jgi:hypothetical protein
MILLTVNVTFFRRILLHAVIWIIRDSRHFNFSIRFALELLSGLYMITYT